MVVPIKFNPEKDIPSLEGKVIFVTGGTAGMGSASLKALSQHNPAHIYFTGRNMKRAQSLIEDIKKSAPKSEMTFIECDFESLGSVRAGLKKFSHSRLDILICNAGITMLTLKFTLAKPPKLSKNGYEVQFAVNHLAHALVIKILSPALFETASKPKSDVRIVILTSLGWRGHPKGGIQFETLNTTQQHFPVLGHWIRYSQSKLANILYASELSRRYPSITSVAVHPGVVKTGLVEDLGFGDRMFVYISQMWKLMEEEGAFNQLWAAAGAKKGDLENGGFYLPIGKNAKSTLDKDAKSEQLRKELWEWTENVLGK